MTNQLDAFDSIIRATLHDLADQWATRIGQALVEQLAAVGASPGQGGGNDQGEGAEPSSGTPIDPPPGGQDTPAPAAPNPKRPFDTPRTCEVCGRVGTRRFKQTPTGWRCSLTAAKCPGNRAAAEWKPTSADEIPAKSPPPEQAEQAECNKVGGISTPNVALPDRSSIPAAVKAKPEPPSSL